MSVQNNKKIVFITVLVFLLIWITAAAGDAPSGIVTDEITVSDNQIWRTNVNIGQGGSIVVKGELTIEGSTIQGSGYVNDNKPVFLIEEGGVLTISKSTFDMTLLPSKNAVQSAGGKLVWDQVEFINNATVYSQRHYITAEGGEVNITGGSKIKILFISYRFLYMSNGILNIDDLDIPVNSDYLYGLFETKDSQITVNKLIAEKINNSVFSSSRDKLSISNSVFRDCRAVIHGMNSELNITEGNQFLDNHGVNGPCGSLQEGVLNIGDDNLFSGNSGSGDGGAFFIYRSTVNIGKSIFRKNQSNAWGGVLDLMHSDVTIGEAQFLENTAGFGGAIFQGGGKLTLNGTVFQKNVANNQFYSYFRRGCGGAIAAEDVDDFGVELTINDAVFSENQATERGGALSIGYFAESGSQTNSFTAVIHKASFVGNKVTEATVDISGGAVYIGKDTAVRMNKLALVENTSENAGGGLATGLTGKLIMMDRNGAVIFNNRAGSSAAGDIYIANDQMAQQIREKMFNGGFHNWSFVQHVSGKVLETPFWDGSLPELEVYDVNGYHAGSSPAAEGFSGAAVLIQGNEALYSRESTDPEEFGYNIPFAFRGNGGGIGINGTLIVGEEGTGFEIRKNWNDNENRYGIRPVGSAFLESFTLTNGQDKPYPLGSIYPVQEEQTEDLNRAWYFAEEDPNVTFIVDKVDDNTEVIQLEGLPLDEAGGSTSYKISEELPDYTPVIEGSADAGFSITNNLKDNVSLNVIKHWVGDELYIEDIRPDYQTFLESLLITADGVPFDPGQIVLKSEEDKEGVQIRSYYASSNPKVTYLLEDRGEGVYYLTVAGLPLFIDGKRVENYLLEELPSLYYDTVITGDAAAGFEVINTYDPPEPHSGFTMYRLFAGHDVLPRTGFSAIRPRTLTTQPKDIHYQETGMILEIPSLSVSANILQVPYRNEEFPVEWLGGAVGLLEGSSDPGDGYAVITGHNHLNRAESGPFAMLRYLSAGDKFFILNSRQEMQAFSVYANEKIDENDISGLEQIALSEKDSLTLITCEDERAEGGYASRRVIAAKPL